MHVSGTVPELPAVAGAILQTLLDRLEQPGRQRVVRVRLTENQHADYFSDRTVAPRHETNAALQELAGQGVLRLHWRKWEKGNWLEAVDLVPERAEAVYALLKRTPRGTREGALRDLLAAQTPQAGWHAAFLKWATARLADHRSVAPLDLDDPQGNADLLRALDALARLANPTLERSLSVRLFGDSKRLEVLRRGVVAVLRRHDPEAAAYGDDDWALLRAHHLERVPEYVPLAGALVLRVNGADLDLAPFAPSVALSAATLRMAMVVACLASRIVTVENATSFSELVAVRPASVLALYTGGFASPAVIAFLQAIRAARPDVAFFHWGDLDPGGLRILAHLRASLDTVTRLAMDVDTLKAHRAQSQALTATDRKALVTLRSLPVLADCVPLIDHLLATGQKLEQEAVDAPSFAGECGLEIGDERRLPMENRAFHAAQSFTWWR